MTIQAYEDLGRRVEKAWAARDHAPSAFPDIAAEALSKADLPRSAPPAAILGWALSTTSPPEQVDPRATFGQPPITLYATPRFHVDALFWVDGSPSIHQHRFSGAFQVLSGSSIHGRFTFAEDRRVSDALLIGRVSHVSSDLLTAGDVVPIPSGAAFVHSTFHLDRPSVSLVVRTRVDAHAPPQYEYWKPCIAIDPHAKDPWPARLAQISAMLRAVGDPAYEATIGDLLARSDACTCLRVLDDALALADVALFDRLLERARPRHGDLVDRMAEAFRNARRENLIRAKRALVHAPEHRFLLAALLNATTAAQVQDLVRAHRPALHPADAISTWVGELAKTTLKLSVAGQPFEPNVLGIPACDEACLDALRRALRGEVGAESHEARRFVDGLRASTIFGPMFG